MATQKKSETKTGIPAWLVLIQGILAVFVGMMLLVWPVKTFTTLVFFLGIWWFVDGILDIVSTFNNPTNRGWKLAMGMIGILAGIFLIQAPLQGALVLAPTYVIVIGVLGVLYGIMGLVNAFRGAGTGAGIVGLLSVILGIYLLMNVWSATLAVPTVFGIIAIVSGITAIVYAYRKR